MYKVNDYNHYGTIEKLMDRISIHNAIFPETRLEVIGFGMKDDSEDNTGFSVILRQPLIQGEITSDPEKVFNSFIARNLLPLNDSSWCFTTETKNIVLSDIHDQNMIETARGNIILFDCEALLNTDSQTKGNYIIPEVKGNEESVRAIDSTLKEIIPHEFSFEDLAKNNPTAAKKLYSSGSYEGLVSMPINGKKSKVVISVSKERKILAIKPSTIYTMVQNKGISASEKDIIASGRTFIKNGKKYYFNTEKGRLDYIELRQIKNKISHC